MEGGFAAHVRGDGRRRSGSDGDADGDANVGFGSAAVSLRSEMEVGGVGGRDGLGAVEVDIADAVDGDGAGVLAAPVEDDGLALIDRERVRGDGGGGSSGSSWGWAGPRALGSTPLAFLWQPVTAPSATRVAAMTRVLLILLCVALIGYLLPSLVFQKINVACETILAGKIQRYFQLQFGMSAPGPVNARFCVPSASMVMIFMWLALPSAVLA